MAEKGLVMSDFKAQLNNEKIGFLQQKAKLDVIL